MAFSSTFKPLYQKQLVSFTLCKSPSNLASFHLSDVFFTFSPSKHSLHRTFSPLFLEVRTHVTHLETTTNLSSREDESSKPTIIGDRDEGVGKEFVGNNGSSDIGKRVVKFKDRHGNGRNGRFGSKRRELGTGYSSLRSKDENFVKRKPKTEGSKDLWGTVDKGSEKDENIRLGMETKGKRSKKGKMDSPGVVMRVGLDRCSKRGDVMNAIRLYDLAKREGIKMGQYHYAIILYLCSSAATGVIQPAKSGSGNRSLGKMGSSNDSSEESQSVSADDSDSSKGREFEKDGSQPVVKNDSSYTSFSESSNLNQLYNEATEMGFQSIDDLIHSINGDDQSSRMERVNFDLENHGIRVDEDVKEYAIKKGFEIYEEMVLEKVPMNEAILTSLARIAMSMGNGDMAFSMVMQMKDLGINPRLRSYGPALSVFCDTGDVEKAFIVEEHMLAHGVYPEEPELAALFRASIKANRSDKVYYLLHKLRTSVRKVLPSTADLIEKWFKSKAASRMGKRKWDRKLLREVIENGGGGWHGQGWLGSGKWTVLRSFVGADALCSCCGEKLVTIDLDPTETENFAESVARIAKEREKNSSFQKFQKWLDYYGPFEAVVDAANVGLFSQRKFRPSKVNTIVNGIRKMLPSKKWPLIVLHNRRISEDKMDEGINKTLIEKWRNADALYATPTGSNDDWYWLYAAIKFRCLIVTNDEMRDHLFQLLGNDFFPKWKERHQVRFNFSDTGPVFHLPPPCSVVIQESEKGHWHIPIISEQDNEEERTWLCITRNQADKGSQEAIALDEEVRFSPCEKGNQSADFETEAHIIPPLLKKVGNHENPEKPPEICRNLRDICSSSLLVDYAPILPKIAAAEKLGGCVIDFQI